MQKHCPTTRQHERGSILVTVAISLAVLIGVSSLAIDLANLYVARSEVQRAADAAALAGATAFVTSGYTSGGTDQATATTQATNQATQVAAQNNFAATPTVSFNFGNQADPQITVTVQRNVPLFFFGALGLGTNSSIVAAAATAEAYNPSGRTGDPTFCAGCLKPMMIANCDPAPAHAAPANPFCPGMGQFIDPNSGSINYPESFGSGGIIGEQITLAYGTSTLMPTPTVGWYGVSIDGSTDTGVWLNNITSCNTALHTCNDMLQTIDVMSAGVIPAQETTSVDSLIHATSPGLGTGQDTITVPSALNPALPYSILGGANNPNPSVISQAITQSDSIATFPIFNGNTMGLVPGTTNLTVIGFMQVFIQSVDGTTGNITATILNVSGCGTNGAAGACGTTYGGGGSGPTGTISGGGSSAIPVRLIQPAS